MRILKYFTPFQWAKILVVTFFTICFATVEQDRSQAYVIASSLASICGIVSVVLGSIGRTAQFYWGFVSVVAYIFISWSSRLFGEVMLSALYYLPMQFLGLYLWKRNVNHVGRKHITPRKLPSSTTTVLWGSTVVSIIIYRDMLAMLGGAAVWLDSTTTVCSIVGNALMVLRYREQWAIWIVVDALTLIMWARVGNPIMTTTWTVYLINAIYGHVLWKRYLNDQTSQTDLN